MRFNLHYHVFIEAPSAEAAMRAHDRLHTYIVDENWSGGEATFAEDSTGLINSAVEGVGPEAHAALEALSEAPIGEFDAWWKDQPVEDAEAHGGRRVS